MLDLGLILGIMKLVGAGVVGIILMTLTDKPVEEEIIDIEIEMN